MARLGLARLRLAAPAGRAAPRPAGLGTALGGIPRGGGPRPGARDGRGGRGHGREPVSGNSSGDDGGGGLGAALANPNQVRGYGERLDPGKPPGPHNPPRRWLSLRSLAQPYQPLANDVEYKAYCP
jgi:hypothetical protein